MNRNEFLNILERSLASMSQSDRDDILYDYKEHFNAGMTDGKSEAEICNALGDPRALAKQYRVDYIVKQADENRSAGNILRAIFAALSLGFFNLIFMLPIFMAFVGVLLGFYAFAAGITLSGLAVLAATFINLFSPGAINMININPGILVFGGSGLTALGLLFCVADIYVTKFFYQITIKYIKANIKIISK
jgi:uncharacterized membrane protein